ncbi:MAG: M14 family zinc carboxypeptidase, partial [Thermoanaerobaculales bacterium]|nr:M14 family zinc carboxypeptidase [Thermoanaerobaculales bacterium]
MMDPDHGFGDSFKGRTERAVVLLAVLVLLTIPLGAVDLSDPDTAESGSVEAIARFTTDPRFVSPWVAYVPEVDGIPSPTDFLGRIVGAPGELTRPEEVFGYLRALDAASPRVHLEEIGRTEEGREILLIAIADEAGIRNLDELKAATAALADPRTTDPERAEGLIAGARPIYYINAGLHADETGPPEAVLELAYRLAVSEQPMIRRIRERVVVLINPVSNPDGRAKMADWFYRYLKGRTDYDALPRQSPPYWGKYVFVDANRDAHQQAQELTKAIYRMFWDYHPTVIHDLHEAFALLQTWNGTGPYNPNLDPIVTSEFLEMSFHEVTRMTALGMPGVWTWDFGEGYGHHYVDSIAMNHNAIGRGYETYGNATGETVERVLDPSVTSREWFRPLPATSPLQWSMRDSVNYTQTGLLAILDYTAMNADEMLRNFYRKGYKSWQKGVAGDPYALVIREDQPDRRRAAQMVNLVMRQGIEVARAQEDFAVREGSFPVGSYVIRLDQPYRNYAVDLLLPQRFHFDDEHLPYDDVSWALPVHYGVEAVRIDDRGVVDVELEPLNAPVRPTGRVTGGGPAYLLRDRGQEALLEARYRLRDFSVLVAEEAFSAASLSYPAGSWILPPQSGLEDVLEGVAADLALDVESAPSVPDVSHHEAPLPRLGVWVPWADTDSIGWLRYALDQRGVPYTYLRDEDIRAGGLRELVDVIVYGHVDLDLEGQIHGIQATSGSMGFDPAPGSPSLGRPVASTDITGGPGWTGVAALARFVEEGGVLVTLGKGSTLALDGGLVRFVRRASGTGIRTPGVELRV